MLNRTLLIKGTIVFLATFLIASLLFLFGVYSQSRNTRPAQAIREIYLILSGRYEKLATPAEQAKHQAEAKAARNSLIHREQGFQRRHEQIFSELGTDSLLRYLYADIDFIPDFNSSYCPKKNLEFFSKFAGHNVTCTRIEYENTEQKTYALIIHSNVTKIGFLRNLLIYNHGHDGIPTEEETFAEKLFIETLRQGSDIMLVSMPYKGLDEINYRIRVKTWDGWGEFNPVDLDRSHAVFELFDTGKSNFIRYFIDNAVINVMHFRNQYNRIDYLGLSGGATTGLYSCALLKKILSNCILVAGVMPAKFRLSRKNLGDVEQFSSSLLKEYKIIDLIREIGTSKTRLALVYNSSDACCFDNPSAGLFQEYLASEKIRNTNFIVRESRIHGYDPAVMLELLGNKANIK